MKFKKSELMEIIDSNGDLIGKNDVPTSGADLETQASNTTDYNAKVGTQPFRYDMLGRFGFTLMPFMEGKENQAQTELLSDLAHLAYERYMEILEYYYRNPNKLKSDFRQMSEKDFDTQPDEKKAKNFECAKKMAKIVEKHFENAFKESENLDEATVVEDKLVDKRGEDEIANRSTDKEVQDKKLEKIAGLINKLDKKDINKLKKLLESNEIANEPYNLNNGFEELYGNLVEKKGNLTTMTDFINHAGLKKLMYGFDPNGFYNDTITLFYYWWDKMLIGDDSDAFESELLNWFNSRYNKKAEKIVALYVGENQQKENGTY